MKKIIIIVSIFICLGSKSKTQDNQITSISGVVTYFYNDNYGNQADVGANVYLFTEDILPNGFYRYGTLDTFRVVNNYMELKKLYEVLDRKMSDEDNERIKKYGINTEDDFKKLDARAYSTILKIESLPNIIKAAVDATGNYNLKVKPGPYTILIISSHREGPSVSEIQGRFYHKRIKLKKGDNLNVSTNFEL